MLAKPGKYIDYWLKQLYSRYSYVTYQGGGKQRETNGMSELDGTGGFLAC